MKIKQRILDKISVNNRIKAKLSIAFDKSSFTIHQWIKDNDENLTKASALKVIREELRLTDSQILEETKKQNA